MCDTLGRISGKITFFAKNSDRSANEAQVLEYHPAQTDLSGEVNCTYIRIPQAKSTYAVLLSRPSWMWGAEMGVNECGLCIGNEAVFTKGAYGKTGLTGMDMVRLALERSENAYEALELILSLLETYGQGGNCGYDHDFYYDNAFLIMDSKDIYVLETAGKQWVYKSYNAARISNRLSIGSEGDEYSGGKAFDFRKRFLEPVYSTFSGSAQRRQQMGEHHEKVDSVGACIKALQQHNANVKNPFAKGSVSSVCMHYGGMVGDHTTSSMVVTLAQNKTVVWSSGCSTPCVSLFKPWLFGTQEVLPIVKPNDKSGEEYWFTAEQFRRRLLGKKVPQEFHAERDEIQARWCKQAEKTAAEDFTAFSLACLEEEKRFYEKWSGYDFEKCICACGFMSRWNKKSKVLFRE